jgi:hypothetical protein
MQILENAIQSKASEKSRRESGSGEAKNSNAFIDPADFVEYHEYLAAVRLERRMSKTAVVIASRLNDELGSGVSNSVLSKIENGQYGEPGFKLMVRIARGYGIPISNLARFFS